MGEPIGGRSIQSRITRFLYRLFRGAPFRIESDPIEPREWLLRRIPHMYFDARLQPPIQRAAFRPTANDIDGISLFREMFLSPKDLSKTGKKTPYVVARIRASTIADCGLTTIASPDPAQPPGHVSLPELSIQNMKKNKQKSKDYQFALAKNCPIAYQPKRKMEPKSSSRATHGNCFAFV